LSYCEAEEDLVQIEESLLLLNILVPDFRLFWDFSAENWDTDENEVAVISRDDASNTIYADGEAAGSLPDNEIPDYPCLVVKNNERMIVSNKGTRAETATYEFADDAYNPAKSSPETRHSSYDADLEAAPDSYPYAKEEELDPLVIAAYNEFNTLDNRTYQRDNVYYGITKDNATGRLRPNIQEQLFMFRVSSSAYNIISDEEGKDPKLNPNKFGPGKGHSGWNNGQILGEIWKDGAFEFVFKIFHTNGINSQPSEFEKRVSVEANKLFALRKIHVDYVNGTAFRRRHWQYSTKSDFLESRWVKIGKDTGLIDAAYYYLSPWELFEGSSVRYIGVFEADAAGTREETFRWTNEFSQTFDVNGEVSAGAEGGVKGSIKVGYGVNTKKTQEASITTKVEIGSEKMGDVDFRYNDPIILSDSEKRTKGYRLNAISTGEVEVAFIPRRK
jgi:hypothetical protein